MITIGGNEFPPEQVLAFKQMCFDDPVFFCTYVLGFTPWSKQAEFMTACATNRRVVVSSAHKLGKSAAVCALALWWAYTRDDARVPMTASSYHQVKKILWRELTRMYNNALLPLGGTLYRDPLEGLVFENNNEIFGFSTDTPERAAGISAANILYIVDEGSGANEEVFPALEGNMAAGAHMVMTSNPTRLVGMFYDAFHTKSRFWKQFTWSGYESPNVTGEREIKGLAILEWLLEKKDEWGEDSPDYAIRCLGLFPGQAENTVIGRTRVDKAIARYARTDAIGPLRIGVDIARFGSDETVIFPVRGMKALPMKVLKNVDGPAVAGHVLDVIEKYMHTDDREIIVKLDIIGLGTSPNDFLKFFDRSKEYNVVVRPVHVQKKPPKANEYSDIRSQMCFDLRDWLDAGGAIQDDEMLIEELLSPTYTFDHSGRRKVSSKDEEAKIIKRSPDRRNALELAIYLAKTQRTMGGALIPM